MHCALLRRRPLPAPVNGWSGRSRNSSPIKWPICARCWRRSRSQPGASRSAGRRRLSVTRLKWWSAAALSVRCWGCCTAMALRWTSPTARSIPPSLPPVFATLKPFIARAGLTPYNVARKRGELKYLLLTASQQGEMMLRFVLRSEAKVAQLRAALPWLQA